MDQMAVKFNKQKVYLEDTINFLKRDNENLRVKISETEKMGSMELG